MNKTIYPVNINNATTVKIMNNVRQRKVKESFLIRSAPNAHFLYFIK